MRRDCRLGVNQLKIDVYSLRVLFELMSASLTFDVLRTVRFLPLQLRSGRQGSNGSRVRYMSIFNYFLCRDVVTEEVELSFLNQFHRLADVLRQYIKPFFREYFFSEPIHNE